MPIEMCQGARATVLPRVTCLDWANVSAAPLPLRWAGPGRWLGHTHPCPRVCCVTGRSTVLVQCFWVALSPSAPPAQPPPSLAPVTRAASPCPCCTSSPTRVGPGSPPPPHGGHRLRVLLHPECRDRVSVHHPTQPGGPLRPPTTPLRPASFASYTLVSLYLVARPSRLAPLVSSLCLPPACPFRCGLW